MVPRQKLRQGGCAPVKEQAALAQYLAILQDARTAIAASATAAGAAGAAGVAVAADDDVAAAAGAVAAVDASAV